MCYECDVRDQDCDIMNGRDIPQTACPGEKCVISGDMATYVCSFSHYDPMSFIHRVSLQ